MGIEAIAGLIPIHLYLQKLSGRSQLRAHALPDNHILQLLMENNSNLLTPPHPLSLSLLTGRQHGLIKGHLVDMENQFNEVFPFFNPLNPEFKPGNRIINCFSNHLSFHLFRKNLDYLFKSHIQQLNNLAIKSSNTPSNTLMVMDASVKNNVASSITHVYIHNKLIIKMLHHTVNVTSMEAEFFAIRCGINQAMHLQYISKIIVVTDSIHVARKIFNPSSHPLQKQAALILNDLRVFFNCHHENTIEFWECPSKSKWNSHQHVNIETKSFNLTPLFPVKNSWEFSKKSECNNIINNWKMTFQASDQKGRNFLDLVDSDNKTLEPTYSKGGVWLQYVGHSNTLCARAARVITNHTPIGEYRLHFFPREKFSCPCGLYSIKIRHYILHECRRFNKYWNPRRDSIAYFIMFLELNPCVFAFLPRNS